MPGINLLAFPSRFAIFLFFFPIKAVCVYVGPLRINVYLSTISLSMAFLCSSFSTFSIISECCWIFNFSLATVASERLLTSLIRSCFRPSQSLDECVPQALISQCNCCATASCESHSLPTVLFGFPPASYTFKPRHTPFQQSFEQQSL